MVKSSIHFEQLQNNRLLLRLHYKMLISFKIDWTEPLFLSVRSVPEGSCTQRGLNDELMPNAVHFHLPVHSPFLPFTSFLSSLMSIHPSAFFTFSYPAWAPFTRLLLKPGKKAQRQQLATLFSGAGIEGLGSSLHE